MEDEEKEEKQREEKEEKEKEEEETQFKDPENIFNKIKKKNIPNLKKYMSAVYYK